MVHHLSRTELQVLERDPMANVVQLHDPNFEISGGISSHLVRRSQSKTAICCYNAV